MKEIGNNNFSKTYRNNNFSKTCCGNDFSKIYCDNDLKLNRINTCRLIFDCLRLIASMVILMFQVWDF